MIVSRLNADPTIEGVVTRTVSEIDEDRIEPGNDTIVDVYQGVVALVPYILIRLL